MFAATDTPEIAALWEALRATARGTSLPAIPPHLADFAALYLPIAAPSRVPFAMAQLGQSLDGYIATSSGASHYVTGPESLVHLHRLRALCDAVIVGWRTVAADDPLLTVRRVTGENPLRVVIDMAGRLPTTHRVFANTAPGALRLTGPNIPPLEGVESVALPLTENRCRPEDVVAALKARGCRRLLVEGGGITVSNFLTARVLTRLHIAVAPLVIGEGRRGLSVPGVASLSEALRPPSRHYAMGVDVLFDLDLNLDLRAR